MIVAILIAIGPRKRLNEVKEDNRYELKREEVIESKVTSKSILGFFIMGVFNLDHKLDYEPVELQLEYISKEEVDRVRYDC